VLSDGRFLYVGGDFDSVDGQARKGFAAFGVAQPAAPQITLVASIDAGGTLKLWT